MCFHCAHRPELVNEPDFSIQWVAGRNSASVWMLSGSAPGAYAEYVVVDHKQLFPMPDGVPLERGSRAEPLAVALRGIVEAAPMAGHNALVFGVLSGAALVALVLVGTTAGAMLDWPALMRVLPERAAPLAVAGSVAWALLDRAP